MGVEAARRIASDWGQLGAEAREVRVVQEGACLFTFTRQGYRARAQALKGEGEAQARAQAAGATARERVGREVLAQSARARRGQVTRRGLTEEQRAFLAGLPGQPALTGRTLFVSEQLQGVAREGLGAGLRGAAQAWQAKSRAEQQAYEQRAAQNHVRFRAALCAFLGGGEGASGK